MWQLTAVNYTHIFDFESNFDYHGPTTWMHNNLIKGVYLCGLYIILIFGGQFFMKKRPKFELRGSLIIWNVCLATFSIFGALRTLPEFITILTYDGLQSSLCVPSHIEVDKVASFWTCMFVFSKLPELGDTFFIVLRKQPLIFLHWYHHVTVLLYTWLSYAERTGNGRWFIVMNYCVHSVMYTYYALKAMRFNPPKQLAMVVTSLQIIQMVIGCIINLKTYQLLQNHPDCRLNHLNVQLSIVMYFSYFILFAKFFYTTYFGRARKNHNLNTLKSKSQ